MLQFDYGDYHINLLDTPGHQDFSEDTYRVLTAVDNAVMVIDSANGVESQTRKLFEVCQRKRVPVFTVINKMDRPGKEPLDLLGEIEDVLGIATVPLNWPIARTASLWALRSARAQGAPFRAHSPRQPSCPSAGGRSPGSDAGEPARPPAASTVARRGGAD